MAFFLIAFAGFVSPKQTTAQVIKQLAINDTLPNITLRGLIKDRPGGLQTNSLHKDGILIINFWATWCVPCLRELQELAELSVKQQGKLRVLCVGYEPKATIRAFLSKHPELASSKLEFISDDKYFIKLFIHQAIPHNVWVNKQGVIKAITGENEINERNIVDFLKNSENRMHKKIDVPFDWGKTLHIPDSLIEYRSIFASRLDGVFIGGAVADATSFHPNRNRFFCFNETIPSIFLTVYQMGPVAYERHLFEVHTVDSAKYFWPGEGIAPQVYKGISWDEWGKWGNHLYTYELKTAKPLPDSVLLTHAIADLELNLHVKTSREFRKRLCSVVSYKKETGLLKPGITGDGKFYCGRIKNQYIIRNVPMSYFLYFLTSQQKPPLKMEPYVDETHIDFPISAVIDLGTDVTKYNDYSYLEKCVKEQTGLNFSIQQRMYPMVVISDIR